MLEAPQAVILDPATAGEGYDHQRHAITTVAEMEPHEIGHLDITVGTEAHEQSFAGQYVVSPHGLLTVVEALGRVGLAATCSTRSTPIALHLFNHCGAVEETSSIVHGGRRKMVEIATRTGSKVKTPLSHRFLVSDAHGWWVARDADEIRPGDRLMVQRDFEPAIGTSSQYPVEVLYLAGVLLADGYFGRNRVMVSNDDPVVKDAIVKYGTALFGFEPHVYPRAGATGSLAYHFNSKRVVEHIYKSFGWKACKAGGKSFGPLIRGLDSDGVRAVLQGYVDCECSIEKTGYIEISSASWTLLLEAKLLLLLHFGIISVLRPKFVAAYPDTDYWALALYGGEAEKYIDRVGFISEIRQNQSKSCFGKDRNPNLDAIPGLGHLLAAIDGSTETTVAHNLLIRDYKGDNPRANVTYPRLGRILDASWAPSLALDRLREIHDARYFFDEVASVTPMPPEPTFDFVTSNSNSFILNGFVTRNSADRLACLEPKTKAA